MTENRDPGQYLVKVNRDNSVKLLMSAGGQRDAAELLQQLYVGLCNQLGVDAFKPVLDTTLFMEYMGHDYFLGEDLTTLLTTEFGRGFMIGRIVSFMERDLAQADNEASEDHA